MGDSAIESQAKYIYWIEKENESMFWICSDTMAGIWYSFVSSFRMLVLNLTVRGYSKKLAKVAMLTRKASVELALRFRLFVHCLFDLAAMFLYHEVWVEQLKNYNLTL